LISGYKKGRKVKIETSVSLYNKESLPQVIERLLAISKTDPNFKLRKKFAEIDSEINELEEKLEKQDKLLLQAEEIRRGLNEKNERLDEDNFDLRSSLLNSLGSAL